jgi:hypothetical protein
VSIVESSFGYIFDQSFHIDLRVGCSPGEFLRSLSAMVSLVPPLTSDSFPDPPFDSFISPSPSHHVDLVDLMARNKYSKRGRTRQVLPSSRLTKMRANLGGLEVEERGSDLAGSGSNFSLQPPSPSGDQNPTASNHSEGPADPTRNPRPHPSPTPSVLSSGYHEARRPPGRPKGSLNKTHVPAWQTREKRRLRQKERREQARLDQAMEMERRREDPSFVSPKRRVGRPRKVRDPMGELLAGAGVTEEGIRLSLMGQHEQVSMGLDNMNERMGLDMTVMGLDFEPDPTGYIHEGGHTQHDHHDSHLQDSLMHQDDGVMHMLEMPSAMGDMVVGVEAETNYLTYGSDTYDYTLDEMNAIDAIERAHAAVRAEEERDQMSHGDHGEFVSS